MSDHLPLPAPPWRPLPLSLGALGGLLRADERGAALWTSGAIVERDWGSGAPSSCRRVTCDDAAASDDLRLVALSLRGALRCLARGELGPAIAAVRGPLAADPRGRWIAASDGDGALLVLTPAGDLLLRWAPPSAGPLVALAPSPDGDRIACAWAPQGHALIVSLCLDPERLGQVAARAEARRPCRALAFHPDGLLAFADGRSVRLLAPDGAHAGELDEQPGDPSALALASGLAAVGYRGGPVALWKIPTNGGRGAYAGGFEGHRRTVRGARFVASGAGLATAGDDQQVALWELPSKQARRVFSAGTAPIESMAMSPARTKLLLGHDDGGLSLVNAADGAVERRAGGHAGGAFAVAWSPEKDLWASAGADGRALLWGSRGDLRGEGATRGQAQGLAFDARGASLLAADSGGVGRLKLPLGAFVPALARVARPSPPPTLARLPGLSSPCNAVARRGAQLAAAGADGLVHLGSIDGFHASIAAHPGRAWSLAFSPTEPLLACGGDDGVALIDARHGERLLRLALDGGRAWAVGFSTNGASLAVASGDGAVRLLDLATGKVFQQLQGHASAAVGVEWGPDALWSVGRDGMIFRWSARGA